MLARYALVVPFFLAFPDVSPSSVSSPANDARLAPIAAAESLVGAWKPGTTAPASEPLVAPAVSPIVAPEKVEQAHAAPLVEPIKYFGKPGFVVLPKGFVTTGSVDVLFQFHSDPGIFETQFELAGLGNSATAIVLVNVGEGTGVYENTYDNPDMMFQRQLDGVIALVQKHHLVEKASIGRIALGSWSAGFGALNKLLSSPAIAERVDAVMVSDGLHAGYMPQGREVNPHRIEAITKFARRAMRGEKLLAMSHTAIHTYGYASTTETTNRLLSDLGLSRTPAGPIVGFESHTVSKSGDFLVLEFGGDNPEAHCEHLRRIGETLLPALQKRWASN